MMELRAPMRGERGAGRREGSLANRDKAAIPAVRLGPWMPARASGDLLLGGELRERSLALGFELDARGVAQVGRTALLHSTVGAKGLGGHEAAEVGAPHKGFAGGEP